LTPNDSICAIATAAGGAARGMVRLSGAEAIEIAACVFRCNDGSSIEDIRRPTAIAGTASVLLHDDRAYQIPCDLFLWPSQQSYTRQPVAELHTLGSPPLVASLLAALCRAGARLAEPGEFTLRAFLAGRIDLTQAEAVLGVIDARGHDDLAAALAQLAGGLARPLQQLRDDLLQLLAELEAGLDFVEEDIEFISNETVLTRLIAASNVLDDIEAQMSSRTTSTVANQIVLTGAPNTGKSSLFNALVSHCNRAGDGTAIQSAPAIVSPRRGTTRDYLTATIEIDGIRCELLDTAGIDLEFADSLHSDSALNIDGIAQSLALQRRATAGVRVCCIDSTTLASGASELPLGMSKAAASEIVILTKADLSRASLQTLARLNHGPVIATSSRTGEGLDELCARIGTLLRTEAVAQPCQTVASTAERCRESICLAAAAILRACDIIDDDAGHELAAAEIRNALAELGKVVGAIYTDDLLDRIFGTFCIGK